MDEYISFGEFIAIKRKRAKYTARALAEALSLSPTYICNIEVGKRSAPSYKIQVKIAKALELNDEETAQLFDLAAKTKQRNPVPQDIAEYLRDDKVRKFLRKAMNSGYKGKDLIRLLQNK